MECIYGQHDEYHNQRKKLEELRPEDAQVIGRFLDSMMAASIGRVRAAKLTWELRKICSWLGKPLLEATREDLERVVRFINHETSYAAETRKDYKRCLKQFYKWAGNGTVPDKAAWIRTNLAAKEKRFAKDILSPEDIKKDRVRY